MSLRQIASFKVTKSDLNLSVPAFWGRRVTLRVVV